MIKTTQRILSSLNRSPTRIRQQGDEARDLLDWSNAERLYKAYLSETPEDGPIWIQLGHALKEQGRLPDAEAAYRRALELSRDDDGYLHLGHVLKLQQRLEEAEEAYAQSAEIRPTKAALDELERLGSRGNNDFVTIEQSGNAELVLFEVDDLLGYLNAHVTVSGIQRVQVGILSHILTLEEVSGSSSFAFVRSRSDSGGFWRLNFGLVKSLIIYCTGRHVEHGRLRALLNQVEQTAIPILPVAGQCYFVLGAFWGFNGDATRYARLKMAGVSVGVYIYDLIPLTHPEYCDAHLVSDFALSFGDGLAVFDFVLTISEYTAEEVRKYIARHGIRPIPVKSVLLAHVIKDDDHVQTPDTWSAMTRILKTRPYILSVSTIEARKNHSYLILAWKLLREEGLNPPDLVFVGRHGWRVNDLMDQLRATNYMDGHVHILHDLSDAQLETLYKNCLFTAFPSFVEGWGLPVGESLAHGKPCMASNTSSIPEVGGDLVDYVDPYSVRSGLDVLRRLMFDTEYRQKRTIAIRDNFKPRTWDIVGRELLGQIARLRSKRSSEWHGPILNAGELFKPSDLRLGHVIPRNYPARPIRLILDKGWRTPEGFGVWMRGNEARLLFKTRHPPRTEVVVYLKLAGAPSHGGARLEIITNLVSEKSDSFPMKALSGRPAIPVPFNQSFDVRVLAAVGEEGEVEIDLSVEGQIPEASTDDVRRLSVGLVALGYAPRSDAAVRADLLDAMSS